MAGPARRFAPMSAAARIVECIPKALLSAVGPAGIRAAEFAASCGDRGTHCRPPGPPASLSLFRKEDQREGGVGQAKKGQPRKAASNSRHAERPNLRTAKKCAKDLLHYQRRVLAASVKKVDWTWLVGHGNSVR